MIQYQGILESITKTDGTSIFLLFPQCFKLASPSGYGKQLKYGKMSVHEQVTDKDCIQIRQNVN